MGGVAAGRAGPGSIRGRKGSVSIFRVPNVLLEARRDFLGGRGLSIRGLVKARSAAGVVILATVAAAYPGYTRPMKELVRTTGRVPAGVVTSLKLAGSLLSSVVDGLAVLLPCILLFAVVMLALTRPGARRVMLRRLCLPPLAFAFFTGLMAVAVGTVDLLSLAVTWSDRHIPIVHVRSFSALKPGWIVVAELVAIVVLVVLSVVAGFVVTVWYVKAIYLAAVDVFRADDAHPLLAPVTTTVAAWALAVIALARGGPAGVPPSLGLLIVMAGPATVTVVNCIACSRLWRAYHKFLFRDGPDAE